MVLSGQAGLLILEKQQKQQKQEQQEIKDIIANREEGYGYQLKVARNEKNLTTADVARELRLDEKIIVAMESEDQGNLPVSAFVCGYIRNYARFLNIQPEPLVEYYKREYRSNCSDPELKITKGKDIKGHTETPGFIMPVIAVVAGALLIFGGWHLWQYVSSEFFNKDSESPIPVAVEQSAESVPANDDPSQLSLPEPDKESYTPLEDTRSTDQKTKQLQRSQSVSDIKEEPISNTVEEAITSEVATPDENSVAITVNPENNTQAKPASAMAVPAEASTAVAVETQGLHLDFKGDSWIVIKDATGKKLATGLKRSGQTLNLEGKAPYNLFLGNGRVVDVSIHGKKYDHSRYINDKNIARFSVE